MPRGCEPHSVSSVRTEAFQAIVLSLPGTGDLSLPIAATRAGGIGLLDLTGLSDISTVTRSVERLQRLSDYSAGVVVGAPGGAVEQSVRDVVGGLEVVLVVPESATDLAPAATEWRPMARRMGTVVTSVEEYDAAIAAGFDFIVAKGNEAGGFVREETTFVLLQRLIQKPSGKPVYAWGGIGLYSAAACRIAGAAGVVLDWQLALLRESPLSESLRGRVARMDGSETSVVRLPDGRQLRCYLPHGSAVKARVEELVESISPSLSEDDPANRLTGGWRQELGELLLANDPSNRLWLMGQDVCSATHWGEAAPTVGRALALLNAHVREVVCGCAGQQPLDRGGPLAVSHGTEFPVVQGPMTRVSDVPEFCDQVERGGGLPFLALALLREDRVRSLLEKTRTLMGDRPWGVGILGFVDRALREEQLRVIEQIHPPFAIIAGGRPDQARRLESRGIATYLHVPSPQLLAMFLSEGSRRFIFEGRECGGHVGPRSSFVLWNTMIRVLLEADLPAEEASQVHVLFAGGICDGLSGAMISAMAEPLVRRGMKVGVLMGTAYLFTHEAVTTGAILDVFQQVATETHETVLLETGPGHTIRCAPTPYAEHFWAEKLRLRQQGRSPEEVGEELQRGNIGRLRIAAKGVMRQPTPAAALRELSKDEQRRDGIYMVGQVAPLCGKVGSIRELHERICVGSSDWLQSGSTASKPGGATERDPSPPPLDIAIVGMSCMLPGAGSVEEFWHNILGERASLEPVPADRFDVTAWYDPHRGARDKFCTTSGGFLRPIPFDPLKYGIPPASLRSIEPVQLLALELVDQALQDAGYGGYRGENPFRERTSIVLGAGGGAGDLSTQYVFRALLPRYFSHVDESLLEQLPEWTEDSFAGLLMNVIAGRIANRFDLGGMNFTVDAACASSLAAIYVACRELSNRTSDMVIAGGCDAGQTPFGYLCFSSAGALSQGGTSRPFDADGDGIAISEGLAAVVLKRLDDAERDGDRVYAVIRAAAGGSDGRSKSMTAPRVEGQVRTFRRAYAQARFSPGSVELFEAHGTGTAVGDRTECESLASILNEHQAPLHNSAVGSVKSNIGHTKCTAGMAGLIKAVLSLYHRVLPPTIGVKRIDPRGPLAKGPVYANTRLRPWIRQQRPRRAGVSSFGFGGTNFHVVLEEYERDPVGRTLLPSQRRWNCELFLFEAASRSQLAESIQQLARQLAAAESAGSELDLSRLALTCYRQLRGTPGGIRAAVVASDPQELGSRLSLLDRRLTSSEESDVLPDGVELCEVPASPSCPPAMLFAGQGSQFPDMLADLAIEFGEVRESFERANQVLADRYDRPLSRFIFPPPGFSDQDRHTHVESLKATDVAQPALGAGEVGILKLLASLGIRPAATAGHSYGELVALFAAGCIDEDTLYRLSQARGRAMADLASAAGRDLGGMLAVGADADATRSALQGCESVWVANLNGPRQTVVSGSKEGLTDAAELLQARDLRFVRLSVACAFHSPMVAAAQAPFQDILRRTEFSRPEVDVYANSTAGPYPKQAEGIPQVLADQLVQCVRFAELVERMYEDGHRIFVEVGPSDVLSKLVGDVLGDRPHVAIPMQRRGEHGVTRLLLALGRMYVHGVPLDLGRLYEHRELQVLDFSEPAKAASENGSPLWLVDGAKAKRAGEPSRPAAPRRVTLTSNELATADQRRDRAGTVRLGSEPPASGQATIPASRAAESPPLESNPNGRSMSGLTPSLPNQPTQKSQSSGSTEEAAYAAFQETMRKFLETQQAVMLGYFGSDGTAAELETGREQSTETHEQISEPLHETADPNRPRPHVQAAAPAAESAGRSQEGSLGNTASGQELPAADESAPPPSGALDDQLKGLVSDRTGYPPEMLNLDVNLESELGIDSIKRVEIIGAFRRAALPSMDEPPSWFMEQMTSAKTLREILDGVQQLAGEHAGGGSARPGQDRPSRDAAPAGAPMDDLPKLLRGIVADRTGYPPEMVDLDINLESELGIDSIKRVEIIGAFRRAALPKLEEPPSWFMEQMTGARTLRQILKGVEQLAAPQHDATASGEGALSAVDNAPLPNPRSTAETAERSAPARAPRCVVRPVEAPLVDPAPTSRPDGVLLFTDDGQGIAKVLAAELLGWEAVVLPVEAIASREAAAAAIAAIRRDHSTIAGVFHLQALRPVEALDQVDAARWMQLVEEEVKSAFYLLQALDAELRRGMLFASISTGAGDFDPQGNAEACHPWRNGLAGVLKCAAKEWPQSRFRLIDVDQTQGTQIAEILLQESSAEGPIEVGYRGGRRWTLVADRVELDDQRPSTDEPLLRPESVVLVTGGARGITAEVAVELAGHYRSTFVLVGRSPLENATEDFDSALVQDTAALRQALLTRARRDGREVTLRQIEDELRALLAQREIRRTLVALQEAGGRAIYKQCDVGDISALEAMLADVQQQLGPIRGLIHGAGIIEDKLIVDKTSESFDRVVRTKTVSLQTLIRILDPAQLDLVMLFSSVAGFYGNAGQCDYAAANEMLNATAARLRRLWRGRVVAMNWGPWQGAGMVTAEIARQLASRGVDLVGVDAGRHASWLEVASSRGDDVRVIIGSGPWTRDADPQLGRTTDSALETPLLHGSTFHSTPGDKAELQVVFQPQHQSLLFDHQMDGQAVLPFTVVLELMAEFTDATRPGWYLTHVEQLKALAGIVLEEGPHELTIRGEKLEQSSDACRWKVSVFDVREPTRPRYQGLVRLSSSRPVPLQPPVLPELTAFGELTAEEAYRSWLFHGPEYQAIEAVHGYGKEGIDATVRSSRHRRCLGRRSRRGWLVDPIVLDTGPQLAIIWSRAFHQTTPLPNRLKVFESYGNLDGGTIEVALRLNRADDQSFDADVWFIRDGEVVGVMRNLEGAGSASLNRVADAVH